ncbi:GNAT family N-acetyltransferase [Rhizobium sp. LjRoot98]|uniref:GNAT family N-acetyltransferase n=1 Tax=unclassified Rhizobium TaxID=2613769 RepID=UPI000713E70E|nr:MULTISPECIES: GNAT family N-acetyltransferase [unclassified Rhizobium]KQV40597.1 acetyltransferase [Rhizobium sp. Root1204]KQX98645.1 acetyltransferase [Rhizobium sp. Root1334]KRC10555.1 acetyltransferase [Rhizobium sp. Root73]
MMIVRLARENEVPALAAIGLDAWEKAVSGVADAQAMRRVAELSFLSFLRSNWFSVSVIETGGAVAGWAAREDKDGTISDLWVEPSLQRNGLGSSLLADLEQRIFTGGFEAAMIRTHVQNAQAIGFFQKHGYAISSLSTAYAPKLDRDVESVGMTKMFVEVAAQQGQQWF